MKCLREVACHFLKLSPGSSKVRLKQELFLVAAVNVVVVAVTGLVVLVYGMEVVR